MLNLPPRTFFGNLQYEPYPPNAKSRQIRPLTQVFKIDIEYSRSILNIFQFRYFCRIDPDSSRSILKVFKIDLVTESTLTDAHIRYSFTTMQISLDWDCKYWFGVIRLSAYSPFGNAFGKRGILGTRKIPNLKQQYI